MNFEILTEITDLETFAKGRAVRARHALTSSTGMVSRVREKAKHILNCRMAMFVMLNFIGMKQMESVDVE